MLPSLLDWLMMRFADCGDALGWRAIMMMTFHFRHFIFSRAYARAIAPRAWLSATESGITFCRRRVYDISTRASCRLAD